MAISARVLCYFFACFEEVHFCTLILYSVPNLNSPFRILDNSKTVQTWILGDFLANVRLTISINFGKRVNILLSVNIRDCLDLRTCKFCVLGEETITNLCWRDSSFWSISDQSQEFFECLLGLSKSVQLEQPMHWIIQNQFPWLANTSASQKILKCH